MHSLKLSFLSLRLWTSVIRWMSTCESCSNSYFLSRATWILPVQFACLYLYTLGITTNLSPKYAKYKILFTSKKIRLSYSTLSHLGTIKDHLNSKPVGFIIIVVRGDCTSNNSFNSFKDLNINITDNNNPAGINKSVIK